MDGECQDFTKTHQKPILLQTHGLDHNTAAYKTFNIEPLPVDVIRRVHFIAPAAALRKIEG